MHVLGEPYTETVVLTQPTELLALGTFVAFGLDDCLVGSGVEDSQHFVLPDCAEEGTIPVPLERQAGVVVGGVGQVLVWLLDVPDLDAVVMGA